MYKKVIYATLALMCSVSLMAAKITGPKGAHPWKLSENANGIAPKFAHWSLSLEGGFNSFDGDFGSEMKFPIWAPAAGISLEYNFTPMWTFGVQYNFDMYRVTGQGGSQHADVLLNGMMHRAQGYLGFDLMSACYPLAKRKIFGLDLFVGGGYGWFKNDIYYPDETRQHTASFQPSSDDDYKGRPFLLAGVLFDFNLSRCVSLGLKGSYSYFIKDDIDGRGVGPKDKATTIEGKIKDLETSTASKNNDGIFDVTLHLRFKLAAVKKTHVKNISSYDSWASHAHLKDTLVISHVDTIYMISESTAAVQTFQEDNYVYIYFEHNKTSLDDRALIDVQQLASRLQREQDMCIEIIGYADNTGEDEHNQNLGEARAQNIRDELVEEHNIDPNRITFSSGGTIRGGRSAAYGPNRRVDIRLMNCGDFGEIKQKNDDRAALAAQAQAQAMAERENGVITAPEGMTLSAISRKYYGNTYCWVFIYEANKSTLKSPNYIPPGTRLVIPDLTDEQRNISKRKAEAYYENLQK